MIRSKKSVNLSALRMESNPYAAILMNDAASCARVPNWAKQKSDTIHTKLDQQFKYLSYDPVVQISFEVVAMRDSIGVVFALSNDNSAFVL